MNRIGRYMEPEGGPLSWYSTMHNINRQGDQDFYHNIGRNPGSGVLSKIKGLFSKAQGSSLRQPYSEKIQRPGLLGDFGRSGFFSKVQDLFLNRKDNVHAVSRMHHFRHPEEGASRPGFISSAPQFDRPGFIAGMGLSPEETGTEILNQSKSFFTKVVIVILAVGIALYLKKRYHETQI